ncbi:15997_t:CDS:2, partial [Gigaspora margarita]
KLESENTLQETLASYWKNKWNEFNKLDFDDSFVSGILYLPFLLWLNELLSTEDIIELKNNSSFIHKLANSWWAEATLDTSLQSKTKAQNKTIRGRIVDFVLCLKSAEDKSLKLFVYEIAKLQDMLVEIIGYFITNYKNQFTDNIVNKLHQIKVYAAIGF